MTLWFLKKAEDLVDLCLIENVTAKIITILKKRGKKNINSRFNK